MADPVTWSLVLSAAVGVGSSIAASKKQAAASRDQKDMQAQQHNEQAAQDAISRRAAIREERIRRAQITQAAANSGAAGSSGEANSISNLSASIGANLSGISGKAQTADQLSFTADRMQGNLDSANQIMATGKTITGMIDSGVAGYQANEKSKLNPDGTKKETTNSVVTPVQ